MCTETKNKPHVHAEVIKAWADGAEIESCMRGYGGKWVSVTPSWHLDCDYRIKPIPKVKKYLFAFLIKGVTNPGITKLYYRNSQEFSKEYCIHQLNWYERIDASVIEV